ncbi:MAG: hypothetical protein GQ559_00475, partial [Desulfobulbaceae bacterium]|nr:hypothetical protein [Desulfobulbaceae bacterium]
MNDYKILNYGSTFLLIFFILLTPVHGVALPQTTTAEVSPAEKSEDPKQEDTSLVDILELESLISKRLIDLNNDIDDRINLAELQEQLPRITKAIEALSWQITMAKSDPLLNYEQLVSFESKLHREKISLKKISTPLADDIGKLARWSEEWTAEQKKLDEWKAKQEEDASLKLAEQHIKNLANSVETALALIEKKIKPMLSASQQFNDFQAKIYALAGEVDDLVEERRSYKIEQTAPSLFSAAFFRQINMKLWQDTWHNITTFTLQQKNLVALYHWNIALVAAVILVLSIFISRSGELVKKNAKWHPFTECPAATAAFTSLSLLELYRLIFSETVLPSGWATLLQFIIIVIVIRLVAILIQKRWKKRLLIQASIFLALTLLLKMVHLPHTLVRLYIFFASLFGVLFYLRYSWKRKSVKESQGKKWPLLVFGLLPAGILIAEITGYDAIALYLFRSILYTVVVALVLWMLFLISSSVSELILYGMPIAILRNNASVLVTYITPAVALFFYIIFLLVILVVWQIYPSSEAAFQMLSSFGVSIGSLTITPGFILAVV